MSNKGVCRTSIKIILADIYTDYESGLVLTGLDTLAARRTARCLAFAKRCLKNEQTKQFFPLNHFPLDLINTEKYMVNFAHTENYMNSTIPYCQRLLNADFLLEEEKRRYKERARLQREKETGAGREGV